MAESKTLDGLEYLLKYLFQSVVFCYMYIVFWNLVIVDHLIWTFDMDKCLLCRLLDRSLFLIDLYLNKCPFQNFQWNIIMKI